MVIAVHAETIANQLLWANMISCGSRILEYDRRLEATRNEEDEEAPFRKEMRVSIASKWQREEQHLHHRHLRYRHLRDLHQPHHHQDRMLIASFMIMRVFSLPQEESNAVDINDFTKVRKFYDFESPVSSTSASSFT